MTQFLPKIDDNDIKDHLEPFILHKQDHPTDRFCSLAVCIKNNININEYEYFPCINALKYVVVNNANQSSISLLLLYKNTILIFYSMLKVSDALSIIMTSI